MKKVTALTILFLCSITSYSQLNKGSFLIGMSTTLSSIGAGPEMFGVGYSTSKTKIGSTTGDPVKTFGINLVPKIGYFISSNIALGIDLNLSYNSSKVEGSGESQTSFFGGIGGFTRYYLPTSKVLPFFELDAGIGKAKVKYENSNQYSYIPSSDSESFFFNPGAGLGLAIPLGKKATIDLLVGYDFIKETPKETYYNQEIESSIHSFGFEIGFALMLGGNKTNTEN